MITEKGLQLYSNVDVIINDIDVLFMIGYENNQNRGNENHCIAKTKRHLFHRIISASTNVAYMGRIGPATNIIIGPDTESILKELDQYDRLNSESKISVVDSMLGKVLCCRRFHEDDIKNDKSRPYFNSNVLGWDIGSPKIIRQYQFSGFTFELQT